MQAIASYLLGTYSGTGKTFILQNWEGDHLLYLCEGTNPPTYNCAPDALGIEGFIGFFNARQDGVDAARASTPSTNVHVYHAVEVNRVQDAMAGLPTLTNNVLPHTRADLYSYSAWDTISTGADLWTALDYLAAKAPDNLRFGRYNVYLGEYGAAENLIGGDFAQKVKTQDLTETALFWGVRYALYWQIFCNERVTGTGYPTNSDMRGYWLVRPDTSLPQVYHYFREELFAPPGPCTINNGCITPIVVALNPKDYKFTDANSGVNFDLDADGVAERTAWPALGSAAAFLWADEDGDGLPTSGSELFGNRRQLSSGVTAADGFQALRDFDDNGDGRVDTADSPWDRLRLWTDTDRNGIASPDEISAPSDWGIEAFVVRSVTIGRRDQHGNLLRLKSVFLRASGDSQSRPYPLYDVILVRE
jgi:hypothetical protein